MKAFCKGKVPESYWVRKETVDIDILLTSSNDDRKIIQPIRTTSGPVESIWLRILKSPVKILVFSSQ